MYKLRDEKPKNQNKSSRRNVYIWNIRQIVFRKRNKSCFEYSFWNVQTSINQSDVDRLESRLASTSIGYYQETPLSRSVILGNQKNVCKKLYVSLPLPSFPVYVDSCIKSTRDMVFYFQRESQFITAILREVRRNGD